MEIYLKLGPHFDPTELPFESEKYDEEGISGRKWEGEERQREEGGDSLQWVSFEEIFISLLYRGLFLWQKVVIKKAWLSVID